MKNNSYNILVFSLFSVYLQVICYTSHIIIANNTGLSLRKRRGERRRGLFGSHFFYIMKQSGIYKITSPTGKIYIGQSNNLKRRKQEYIRCGQDVKSQRRLYRSLKKYGYDMHKFEVVEFCDFDKLNERERFYQEKYDVIGKNGLNCQLVNTSVKKARLSEDTKKRIGKAFRGRKLTEEHKRKIGEKSKGKRHTEETKKKFVAIGKARSREALMKMHVPGYKHSEEAKKKMSEAHLRLGPIWSEEEKREIGNRQKKYIIDTKTGDIFWGIKACAKAYGINHNTLRGRLSGHLINNTNLMYLDEYKKIKHGSKRNKFTGSEAIGQLRIG